MIECPANTFVKGPVGRYTVSRSCVVWCASRSLCGLAFWGRPLADELFEIATIVEAYPQQMAPTFEVVVDGRQVEALDGEALSVQMAWLWRHGAALLQRANIWSIVAEGTAVARLAQAMPALAGRFAFRVTTDAPTAFRAVAGEAGAALSLDVDAIAASARGLPREIHRIRALLARRLDSTRRDDRRRGERAEALDTLLAAVARQSRDVLSPGARSHPLCDGLRAAAHDGSQDCCHRGAHLHLGAGRGLALPRKDRALSARLAREARVGQRSGDGSQDGGAVSAVGAWGDRDFAVAGHRAGDCR